MPEPLKVLIVDDEPPARQIIYDLLASVPDTVVVGEAADGVEAVAAIRTLTPDLVFLDIQMPGLDGFGVIDRIGLRHLPGVIFVTAYSEHALSAFEVHAVDYLLKPVSPERFHAALDRARRLLAMPGQSEWTERVAGVLTSMRLPNGYPERLLVRSAGVVDVVQVADIDWIEAERDYVWLHVGDARHLMREKIGALEKDLNPDLFVRIHRSAIVRLDRIRDIKAVSSGDYKLTLQMGTVLSLSRTYHHTVVAALTRR